MEGADCKGIYREGDSDIQVRQGFNGAQAPPNLRKHATTLTK